MSFLSSKSLVLSHLTFTSIEAARQILERVEGKLVRIYDCTVSTHPRQIRKLEGGVGWRTVHLRGRFAYGLDEENLQDFNATVFPALDPQGGTRGMWPELYHLVSVNKRNRYRAGFQDSTIAWVQEYVPAADEWIPIH